MFKKSIVFIAFLMATHGASAQQPMARCVDVARGGIPYIIMNNGYAFQENFPANAGWAARDPSGQMFMRLPAQNPMTSAFFMSWQGQLIELNIWSPGPMVIGQCAALQPMPAPPPPMALPHYSYTNNAGVVHGREILPVPQPFYQQSMGFSPPPARVSPTPSNA